MENLSSGQFDAEALDRQGVVTVSYGSDASLYVKFFKDAVKLNLASEAAKYPIFEDRDFVEIMIPGDKNTIVVQEVKEEHKTRFPRQWAAYSDGMTEKTIGFPLKQWPILTVSQIKSCEGVHIYTVEQLANATEMAISKIFDGRELQIKARAFLEQAKNAGFAEKLAKENDQLKNDQKALEAQIKELAAKLEEVAKIRGRKNEKVTDQHSA